MTKSSTKKYWTTTMLQIVDPVLKAFANKELKLTMPVEGKTEDRPLYTHLEALGRTLTGMSPWLESKADSHEEEELKEKYAELSRLAITSAVDPESPDYLNFTFGFQPIVDAAFLAHAIIRAPQELWFKLDKAAQKNLVTALKATRTRKPGFNNWLLFSAMIESALYLMGEEWDSMRVDYAIKQHEQWYLGDGMYGDGPDFHWDYYNSFVIQPMLTDIILTVGHQYDDWNNKTSLIIERLKRNAAIQEMLISPEGTYPVIGRSVAYRFGAFQSLAQASLMNILPENIHPAEVRCALTAVIKRVIEAPGTFDENGWLKIGVYGSQPDLGETYISTGSLYLCTAVFLPLGLSSTDPFWSGEERAWSSVKVWSGENLKVDHALYNAK